ncbi:hypothetical protein HYC85_002983 [Camellia sinensis]|uniref:USP domain-containing protein n=1 Tax=Camellia sinensis TaxID=4442 RepID=A0A7J7IBG7_CAMSI|nr:hypothetical protein HYC85_002983 [Camellia sinensis]
MDERKLKEMLEYQKKIEDEAKLKNLAKQNKNAVATITAESEKMDVTCSTLSDDCDPGVPVSTLEETKVLDNSSKVQTTTRRSRTLGEVRQETLVAQKSLSSTTSQRVPPTVSSEEFSVWSDLFGPGLRNDVGENNCFLNAQMNDASKCYYAERSFDELLELAEMHHYRICDPEVGGCGKLDNVHDILSTPPHVFTTVLGWESRSELADDISATLRALRTEIDIGVMYEGVDPGKIYSLISMVIGYWDDVLAKCEKGYLHPQVLYTQVMMK